MYLAQHDEETTEDGGRVHLKFSTLLKEILCSHYDGTLTFSLEAHNREMDLIQTYIKSIVL